MARLNTLRTQVSHKLLMHFSVFTAQQTYTRATDQLLYKLPAKPAAMPALAAGEIGLAPT